METGGSIVAQFRLGIFYYRQQRFERAMELLRAIIVNPSVVAVYEPFLLTGLIYLDGYTSSSSSSSFSSSLSSSALPQMMMNIGISLLRNFHLRIMNDIASPTNHKEWLPEITRAYHYLLTFDNNDDDHHSSMHHAYTTALQHLTVGSMKVFPLAADTPHPHPLTPIITYRISPPPRPRIRVRRLSHRRSSFP